MRELNQPKPGEEIWVRFDPEMFVSRAQKLELNVVKEGRVAFTRELSNIASAFPCPSKGRFETAHICPFCPHRTAVFVAALMTFFLEGSDAASKYYKD